MTCLFKKELLILQIVPDCFSATQNTRILQILDHAEACNFIKKETLAKVFSREFCEISKNTFSYGTPPVAASVNQGKTRILSTAKFLLAFIK